MEKICVAVRVRPPVSQSHEFFNGNFWKVEEKRISLHKPDGAAISGVSFAFDHIFDNGSSNSCVYELLTKEIINAAVEGFNGTAFAYGQTSSGKTFTMNGSENDPGIIPRAVKDVFGKIQTISDREFLIRVSYMEIYNEEINDLLVVENRKLQIHESLERGIFVAGLREEIVSTADQVLELIKAGEVNRHFGETNMNVRSSRSHTIFRMVIESKGKDTGSCSDYSTTDAVRVSVLNLVDLAGSERIAKTGVGGVRLQEGKHINKSLMVLGNVINKLSDGSKQRGHIPYRDSKLTRILQPALGGNAKTSIICTVAPEEVHIEETKGTLQFASRAKRITNCVQVNEILTDAALLKRQKLEIEELRMKLQGSHAEVLEQEILKLRNDLLKYELEREKLEMELEAERKSHKERDRWIKEQQMKIENLSTLVSLSDSERKSSQGLHYMKQDLKDEFDDHNRISQGDIFRTPTFKAAPKAFVARRSDYSTMPDYSPLPDSFSNVADEDTWMKMNRGYVADLDSLGITPAKRVQSFPFSDATPGCSHKKYEAEVLDLRRQLEIANKEKNELERKHAEQVVLNNKQVAEVSKLQYEAQVIQQIPKKLSDSLASCKDMFEDVLSTVQNRESDGGSSTSGLLSSIKKIGLQLFTTLEAHVMMTIDGQRSFLRNDSASQEQQEALNDTLSEIISSSERATKKEKGRSSLCRCEHKECPLGGVAACWKERLNSELNSITERNQGLEKELVLRSHSLEECEDRYNSLKREVQILKLEKDSLLQTVSELSERLALVTTQKENALETLNKEVQRRKCIEEDIKQLSVAFGSHQKSLASFHSEFKTNYENLRAQGPISMPKSLGYQD